MCEFPSPVPADLEAEAISLESLVHNRYSVEASSSLEVVHRVFQQRRVEFLAVIKNGRVIGMCARGHLGFVMSSRFGFALYSQRTIETLMVAQPLIVKLGTAVRTVLDRALVREGEEFHEDVVLISAEGALVGLIKVETLAHLQSRLVQEQLAQLRQQHETLRRQNLELFQTTHAARQSTGLYLSLVRSHALGIALLDRHGNIHERNARLAELLNCGVEPVGLQSLTTWIAERERETFLTVLEAQASDAAPSTREFTLNVPERGPRIFRISTGWVRETGQICACLEDVTEQRALERNALRQEKQVLLDTLVGGIAHELNNKLTPVQGFSELLSLEAGPGAPNYAPLISQSVAEAARIIRQLLELSRPATHVAQLLDLRSVIEESLVMLRFQLRESGCRLRTALPAEPVYVSADASQLKQVALNLIINALHAMEGKPAPELTIEVTVSADRAQFLVKDTGCGISAENLERIFDPFFTTKGPERGTGLGLSICFSLVRQHGGEIAVVSEPGAGATFTVSLPLQASAVLFVAPTPEETPPEELPRGARVLVVEDEAVVRHLMQEVLCTRLGCQVDAAANGREALACIEQHTYSLILSDIRMPELDGPGLYLQLRDSRPELAQRLIFVTGHPGEKGLESEIAQWRVPVLAKPFSLARLTEVCRPYLQDQRVAVPTTPETTPSIPNRR